MKNNVLFTIFTPTYNRAYTLDRLYRSLIEQTSKNFKWIIVDDGSTDNTKELVSTFSREFFDIIYTNKKNGGKHRAINVGLDIADTEYFFIVDSDDYLIPKAISIAEEKVINTDLVGFAGIAFNRGYSEDQLIGKSFSGDYIDATNLERKKFNILGDKAEIYKTSILKLYKFPEFEGENFISEMIVWNRIARDGYKIRWFNEILYITNYLEDGLTVNSDKSFSDSPKGYALMIKEYAKFANLSVLEKLRYYAHYCRIRKMKEPQIKNNELALELDAYLINIIVARILSFGMKNLKRIRYYIKRLLSL